MDGKKKLRWNAVPTLFNIPNPPKTITCRRKRVHRSPARELDSGKTLSEHSYSKKRVCESATSSAPCSMSANDVEEEQDTVSDCVRQNVGASTVASLRADVDKLKKQVKQLRQQLRCERNSHTQLVSSLKQFLTPDQIRYLKLSRKSIRTARWSNSTIKRCLQLRYATGRKGYSHLRRLGYPVPAYRTLCNRVVNASFRPGIQADVLEWLKVKMTSQTASFRDCSLALDEMQLRPCVEYDRGNFICVTSNLFLVCLLFAGYLGAMSHALHTKF